MRLFKFRLRPLGQGSIPASHLERIFSFPRAPTAYDPSIEPGAIFVTPDGQLDARHASAELSITYDPGYRYTVDDSQVFKEGLVPKDNLGNALPNLDVPTTAIPRVWPAFGLPGGRRELLLVSHGPGFSATTVANSEVALTGGAASLWYQDDVVTEAGSAIGVSEELAAGIADGVRGGVLADYARPPSGDGPLTVLVRDGTAVLAVALRNRANSERFASLSSAFVQGTKPKSPVALPNFGLLSVRFWVALWQDIGQSRWLLNDAIEPLGFDCPCCLGAANPREIAAQASRVLLSRALEVSDSAFLSRATQHDLPP
ncbi:MAG: hypothetical protein L3K19_00190 [Thermoplasmata archaeon]|nr:hypothetical protein [Thermoplasmata archaeon]